MDKLLKQLGRALLTTRPWIAVHDSVTNIKVLVVNEGHVQVTQRQRSRRGRGHTEAGVKPYQCAVRGNKVYVTIKDQFRYVHNFLI